ncbi:hypothetical protein [Candidatus Kuenenia sp.]|uniref:hypothetical protein n=1 Tax=Candidatus Kuenenia sp. TaxID=2499824 RepID=UPI00321F96E6
MIYMKYLPYILNCGTRCYVRLDINPKLMNNEMAKIRISVPSLEGLNFADFGCFNVFVPTKEEQKVIVDFLERKISEIDGLIQKIESAIAKLREYRSSLITAAVTGKIDVRGAVKC